MDPLDPGTAAPERTGFGVAPGREADVSRAVAALSGHMDSRQRQAFADKLRRYALKEDRMLFLAWIEDEVAGFSTVIVRSPPPADLLPGFRHWLAGFACGTGLFVHPRWREHGLGRLLVKAWEDFAAERERTGIWAVTRRMAPWYQKQFGYKEIGATTVKGVVKTVIVKVF